LRWWQGFAPVVAEWWQKVPVITIIINCKSVRKQSRDL
jgi:hypothetical protein